MRYRSTTAHEDLNRKQHVVGSSDRAFAVVMAGECVLLALGLLRYGHAPRWWAFAVAGPFWQRRADDLCLGGMDDHWTARGKAYAAELMAEFLRAQSLLAIPSSETRK
jgi:hypothetical protein